MAAAVVLATQQQAPAQTLRRCVVGQPVIDRDGRSATIVSAAHNLCVVRYRDGQVFGWTYWTLRAAGSPGSAAETGAGGRLISPPAAGPPPRANSPGVTILKAPPPPRSLVVRGDGRGHFVVTAAVNGAPIRFLVDTGASLVTLTLDDAEAAGINRGALVFDRTLETANGPVRAAAVRLHEIEVGQLSLSEVPAAVVEPLGISVLGMSFLTRLKSFEVHGDTLTLVW